MSWKIRLRPNRDEGFTGEADWLRDQHGNIKRFTRRETAVAVAQGIDASGRKEASVVSDSDPGIRESPRRMRQESSRWTVGPGRTLLFEGNPAFHLSSEDNVRLMPHVATDAAAHLVAELFNKNRVTPSSLYERTMGRPMRRR